MSTPIFYTVHMMYITLQDEVLIQDTREAVIRFVRGYRVIVSFELLSLFWLLSLLYFVVFQLHLEDLTQILHLV